MKQVLGYFLGFAFFIAGIPVLMWLVSGMNRGQFLIDHPEEMARTIGINKSLLSRYIYGIKKPSAQRTE